MAHTPPPLGQTLWRKHRTALLSSQHLHRHAATHLGKINNTLLLHKQHCCASVIAVAKAAMPTQQPLWGLSGAQK